MYCITSNCKFTTKTASKLLREYHIQSPRSRKPYGGTKLFFKPVCRDSSEFHHCLLLISFGKNLPQWEIRGGTTRTGDLKCREVKLDFAERYKCKPALPRLSLAGNLEKPLMSLYWTEWRERGYDHHLRS